MGAPARRGSVPLAAALPGRVVPLAALAALLSVACARKPPPPQPAPGPGGVAARPPAVRAQPRTVVRNPSPPRRVAAPAPTGELDPIVSSAWAGETGIEEGVQWWLEHWRTRGRAAIGRGLVRMGRYEDYIDAELAARGLPPSLRYLPLIEANYFAPAVSPVGAAGLWQFMPETARWLGLEVGSLVDRRFDPYASTPHALDYLAALRNQFGSWFLALAAYNGGPGRVERAIQRHGDGLERNDALFAHIRDRLPKETRDFIPKYLAAVRVAEDPAAFGLPVPRRDPPERFDVVRVEGAASADVLADAAGVSEDDIRTLNPHLHLGLTPAAETTEVRVPVGTAGEFLARFAEIPPGDRVTLREHTVVEGETLSHIARQYLVSVDALRAANPEVEPRRMQIGTVLVIPRAAKR